MPGFNFKNAIKKDSNSKKNTIIKRGVNDSKIKAINTVTTNKTGDINVVRDIYLSAEQAENYFDDNLFIKFSFECFKAFTNIDYVGFRLLCSILKKNIIHPTIELGKNHLSPIILADKISINEYAEEIGYSERHIRNGFKTLIDNEILYPRQDKNGFPQKGIYILNINFINNLNFQQWYSNLKIIKDEFHVNLSYKIHVK